MPHEGVVYLCVADMLHESTGWLPRQCSRYRKEATAHDDPWFCCRQERDFALLQSVQTVGTRSSWPGSKAAGVSS